MNIRWDTQGNLRLVWPKKYSEVMAMAQAFVTYESGLPAQERLAAPSLGVIQGALDNTAAAVQAVQGGELDRATASTRYHQTMEQTHPLLDIALLLLQVAHTDNLAELKAWGLEVRGNEHVYKPTGEKGWAKFLLSYVEQESSLPEAERLVAPPLAQIAALAEALRQSMEQRQSGLNRREKGVKDRAAAAAHLRRLLQAAAAVLIATRYDGRVVNDLQQWGYQVVAKKAQAPAETPS